MTEWWPSLLGWPALMIALGLAAVGIIHHKWRFYIFSVLLLLPVSFYLAGTPRIGMFALISPVLLAGSGVAVWRQKTGLAWLLLLPVAAAAIWFAVLFVSPR